MLDEIEEPKYFSCACYSDEHTMKFQYLRDDEDARFSEVCASFYVGRTGGCLVRLWAFVKFLFGHRTKYGDFDNFILREKDVDKLLTLLSEYKADMLRKEKSESEEQGDNQTNKES